MNFICIELLFIIITVTFAKHLHGSRLTNNEVSFNPPDTHQDSVKEDSSNNINQEEMNTFSSDTTTIVSNSTNNITTGADQLSRKDDSLNIFAQRIGQNIFHNAPKDISSLGTDKHKEKFQTLMWSPISVYQSLLPLYLASAGETKEELQQLLLPHVNLQSNLANYDNNVPTFFNFTDLNNIISDDSSGDTLSSMTGLFVKNDLRLNPDYVQDVQNELKNVDVKTINFNYPANAATSINKWVQNGTRGLINDAVDESQVYPDMFMMIVNCVRFKASWKSRFNTKQTKTSNFYGVNGVQKVQMMKQIGTHKFVKFPIIYSSDYEGQSGYNKGSEDVSFSVLEMPYADENFASLFILPETTEKLQATLDYITKAGVEKVREMLQYSDVEILMPKFKLKSNVNVEKALIENGLTTLFNPLKANLAKLVAANGVNQSKITNNNNTETVQSLDNGFLSPPYLSNIIHKTIFETTEEGTTAAALTALSIVPLSALSQDVVYRFNLNRPFIILLIKNDNTVVFQGVIADLVGQDYNVAGVSDKNAIDEKTSNSAPIGNSLSYPSSDDGELDKLINFSGDETKDVNSGDAHTTTESLSQNEQTGGLHPSNDTEVRSWWIPKKIPAYLIPVNETTLNSSSPVVNSTKDSSHNKNADTLGHVEETTLPPAKIPFEPIQFSKYQQPEPKDPNGIRFPATFPLARNRVNIKPRFQNHDNVKRTLNRWMYTY